MNVRPYAPGDWERLCVIHDAARLYELQAAGLTDAFLSLAMTAENEGLFNGRVYVAELYGKVQGFVAFTQAELTWLYVDPGQLRQGIGRQLLRAAIAACDGNLTTEVLVGNEAALALYLGEGFTILRRADGKLAGHEAFAASGYVLQRVASEQGAAPPCSSPEHRAFDFWIGEWNVAGADGKLAGTNSIQRELGGCVLHERYATARGYVGESFNVYDASRQLWHQTWVDSAGLLLVLEGGVRAGNMVLEGQTMDPGGKSTKHRITWTPGADGSVRQFWETTDANGEWVVAFDGRYTRR